jgi:phage gp45-like|tara:strand:- start:5521 stop:6087 length:567 start_codon:yes stop_codon:yes gene_type:complete
MKSNKELQTLVSSLLSIARTTTPADNTKKYQTHQVQGYENEVLNNVQNLGMYGLTSKAPINSPVIVGYIGGSKELPFILAVGDDGFSELGLTLADGESALYSSTGAIVHAKATGEVQINKGTDYAVQFSELKTQFDELKGKYNSLVNILKTWTVVPADGGAALKTAVVTANPISTADLTGAKVEKVRL